jgi:serine/threonine protein kinase
MSLRDSSSESPDPASDWTPPAVADLAPDFPGLEIESLLAQGGMSAVYLARQRSLDRRVVLKVLPVEVGADTEAANRFMREARVLAKLRDPGIVEIYDSGLSPRGHLFLVLEWEEGGDLRHWAQSDVGLDDALGIGESVCAALSSAHAESIVHGDIKPDNIFIDGKGRLKVGDFGLADIGGEGRAVFHTPGYTAPEILTGTAGSSPRSDIFAAGAMVFELVFRRVPPDLPAERAAMLASLPPAASRALGQMLESDPAKRPASADACRKALADARRALNAVPAPRILPTPARSGEARYSAPLPSPPRPRKRSIRRAATDSSNSGGAGKLIAAAAVIVIAGGIWMLKNKEAPPPESGPAPETARGSPERADPKPKPAVSDASQGLFDFKPEEKPTSETDSPPRREREIVPATAAASAAVPKVDSATAPPPIDPALVPLRQKYVVALTNAAKAAEQAKESSGAVALRAEIGLIEKGGSPPDVDDPGIPADLAKLRGIYRKESAALMSPAVTASAPETADNAPGNTAPESSGKPPLGMPSDAVPFNGKWYRFYPECPTWHAAKEKCERLNGRLAVVTDQATWTFVKGLLGDKWAWLGATDEKSEGVWSWVDGSSMTLKKWQSGEPNNRDAKQHYLKASMKGWRDDPKQSSEVDGYLCEWKPL